MTKINNEEILMDISTHAYRILGLVKRKWMLLNIDSSSGYPYWSESNGEMFTLKRAKEYARSISIHGKKENTYYGCDIPERILIARLAYVGFIDIANELNEVYAVLDKLTTEEMSLLEKYFVDKTKKC